MWQLSVRKHKRRSGPQYVMRDGETVTYVEELEESTCTLGALRIPLPTARRVYLIDSAGVRRLDAPPSPLGLAIFLAILGLLAALSRLRWGK